MIIQPVDNNLTELKLKLANPYKVELLELLYTNSQIQVFNYNKTEILKILSSYGNIFLELS